MNNFFVVYVQTNGSLSSIEKEISRRAAGDGHVMMHGVSGYSVLSCMGREAHRKT